MRKIFLAIFLMLGLGGLAQATLPPKVGDQIERVSILCDEVEQARSIVQAAQDLGWEDGGQVMLDDLMDTDNVSGKRLVPGGPGEPICAPGTYIGKVTAVESMGVMPYMKGIKVNIWLVSIDIQHLKGTIIWSDPIGSITPTREA